MSITDEERIRRRKQKFSAEASNLIINDPLSDVLLLSRSANSDIINSLRNDPELREGLISNIEHIYNEPGKDNQVEHGLRKLREILSSCRENAFSKNEIYWKQTSKVYDLSYEFYLRSGSISKVGDVVLKPIMEWFLRNRAAKYIPIYQLYISHFERDIAKCTDEMFRGNLYPSRKDMLPIKMANIYVLNSGPVGDWFRMYHELTTQQQEFLVAAKILNEMVQRSLTHIKICYNQLSFYAISKLWLDNDTTFDIFQELTEFESTKVNGNKDDIIMFRKPKNRATK